MNMVHLLLDLRYIFAQLIFNVAMNKGILRYLSQPILTSSLTISLRIFAIYVGHMI